MGILRDPLGSMGGNRAAFGGGSFNPFKMVNGPKGGRCLGTSFWFFGIGSCRWSPNVSAYWSTRRRLRGNVSCSKEEYGNFSTARRFIKAGSTVLGGLSALGIGSVTASLSDCAVLLRNPATVGSSDCWLDAVSVDLVLYLGSLIVPALGSSGDGGFRNGGGRGSRRGGIFRCGSWCISRFWDDGASEFAEAKGTEPTKASMLKSYLYMGLTLFQASASSVESLVACSHGDITSTPREARFEQLRCPEA